MKKGSASSRRTPFDVDTNVFRITAAKVAINFVVVNVFVIKYRVLSRLRKFYERGRMILAYLCEQKDKDTHI